MLFFIFISCSSDPSHLLFSWVVADAEKSAHLSFSTTLRKQQMDVLSSIRNMCRYYVTGSIVVPVYREPTQRISLLAPISYTRYEEELLAVSVFFPRRHSVRVCTMLFFFIEAIGLVLHIYDKTMINIASFLLTFSPQDRNIHFPENCIYFLYFWNSRRWTKSKL